jgi:hypothetical protein
MTRSALAMLLAAFSTAASADRITELCVYTAKLHVAGYFYYLQGAARADAWHNRLVPRCRIEMQCSGASDWY